MNSSKMIKNWSNFQVVNICGTFFLKTLVFSKFHLFKYGHLVGYVLTYELLRLFKHFSHKKDIKKQLKT